MWNYHSGWFGFDPDREPSSPCRSKHSDKEHGRRIPAAISNSPDDVFGEVGLVLVVILGVMLAINAALAALHIA